MLFSLIGKIPKYFMVLCLFITTFLLSFLLIGCIGSSKTYSDVYLTKLSFNKSSVLYPNIKAAYKSSNSSINLSDVSIRIGYLSACVDIGGNFTCTSISSLNKVSSYSGISIVPTKSSSKASQIDLIGITQSFSNICHPSILMAAIILTLVLLIILCYCSVPLLPGKPFLRKANCFISAANVLLWGLGSMLQHEAVKAAHYLVNPASMSIISATIGKRAEAMTWTAFTFLLIVAIGSVFVYIRELKKASQEIEPKF